MRLAYPKEMSRAQERALKVCLSSSTVRPSIKEILDSLSSHASAIEDGVRVIDAGLSIPGAGEVDLVAMDADGGLVLIDLFEIIDVASLSRVFVQCDWAAANRETLDHFYPGFGETGGIRVWVFTEAVGRDARPLFERMDAGDLWIFEHEGVLLDGEEWLVVRKKMFGKGRPVSSSIQELKPPAALPARMSNSSQSLHFNSILSNEEIEDFFKDDDVTVSGDRAS